MDPIQGANVNQVAAASKSGKVAKAVAGAAIVAGAAVLAAAAHKGDVFNKVKGIAARTEGSVIDKAKAIFTGENIKKGFKALGEGFKALPEAAKALPAKAKEYGAKAVEWVKSKLPNKAETVAKDI